MLNGWTIRWRLTAWYLGAMFLILLMFGLAMHFMIRFQMFRQLDDEMTEEANELVEQMGASASDIEGKTRHHFAQHGRFSFQIENLDGTVAIGSPWLRVHSLPRINARGDVDRPQIESIRLGQLGVHRILTRSLASESGGKTIRIVAATSAVEQQIQVFTGILLLAGLLALIAACLGGAMITRQAMHPIEQMAKAAERISADNCDELIAPDNPNDELGRLATTLNQTIVRLRKSIQQSRRFTADAAHELRTPLAIVTMECDVALREDLGGNEIRRSMKLALEEIKRLTHIVDQLLLLSRMDSGTAHPKLQEVFIQPLLFDIVELLEIPARNKGVSLSIGIIPDRIIQGDDVSLSRLFFNLIDNAIKYTQAGGSVDVRGTLLNDRLTILVEDTGIGIDRRNWQSIFERFYRVDASRSSATGGTGLGLSICKSIVDSHGAILELESTVGLGSTFSVTFPDTSIGDPENTTDEVSEIKFSHMPDVEHATV